ncbi:response regulator transcription factor [Dethiothermospora halolimnae]|uniref:response regulator transcription factor n=1 Tax=Dethiothermospora halolimnae TaxID=3114390 RepID=UPI003CCBCF67
MVNNKTILIVDDEKEIGQLIRDYLKGEGFQVILAFDGEEGLKAYRKYDPILAILDIMLPKLDGIEICKIIRNESTIPILMLSAKKSETDKILGVGFGADNYITKPFSPSEVVARIKAQLRRYTKLSSPKDNRNILKFEKLEIDVKAYNVYLDGKEIDLAAKEFEILTYLSTNINQVFTREQIFNHVWGYREYGDINTVTVHIRRIREKLEKDPKKPKYIKTVWGVGYKFDGGE